MQSVDYLNGLLTFRSFFNEFPKEHGSGQKQDRKIEQLPDQCFALEERAGIPPTTPLWHNGPRVIWGIARREQFHALFGYLLGNRDGTDNWHKKNALAKTKVNPGWPSSPRRLN